LGQTFQSLGIPYTDATVKELCGDIWSRHKLTKRFNEIQGKAPQVHVEMQLLLFGAQLHPAWSRGDFDPIHRRLRCGPHTLNLIGQVLLWGRKAEAFNNNHASSDIAEETELMKDWRRDGPLGVLLGVISHIKTPQQYALFEKFQRLAQSELPAEKQRKLEPLF
jgi:hypothetical protein